MSDNKYLLIYLSSNADGQFPFKIDPNYFLYFQDVGKAQEYFLEMMKRFFGNGASYTEFNVSNVIVDYHIDFNNKMVINNVMECDINTDTNEFSVLQYTYKIKNNYVYRSLLFRL